jgi:uncharacterized pyridoxal phosphate-containing UPF0001 family protein
VACHFIGHLQKNKVKKAVALFDCIQSVDDLETLALISREARQLGRTMDVLFEVNTSGEDSKQGVRSLDDLRRLVAAGLELPAIRLRGLMTIGPLGGDEPAVRRAFAGLAGDFRRLAGEFGLTGGAEDGAAGTGAGGAWSELSMGMSGDYPWAIAEGASLVRIGTAIFGPRLGGRLA